jgi:hypothetical protein
MRIELTRFRVREGKAERVDEWMEFLNDHPDALRETLEPEHMYVETIFSESIDGVDYLYWYSVQGEEGRADVTESHHWLDEKHVEFWQECIDDSYPGQDLTSRVFMLPERVAASMKPRTMDSQ